MTLRKTFTRLKTENQSAMKGNIVLIQFPFDDLSASKVRPAYVLTETIGMYQHMIFALITSRIPLTPLVTDILLQSQHPDFGLSGLQKPSTLRLDHLVTLRQSMIRRELGALSAVTQAEIAKILCAILSA
jgi:mRNA interferase MazF